MHSPQFLSLAKMKFILIAILFFLSPLKRALCQPLLSIDGFSWAENLVFDGKGNLFVSEAVRGEIWRIFLSESGNYSKNIHLSEGLSQVGGMVVSPDAKYLYAGVTFDDKSQGIINVSTIENDQYTVLTKTMHQPNGFVVDWYRSVFYYTDEGTGHDTPEGGTLRSYNLKTGEEKIAAYIPSADGAWLDERSGKLYVGELVSKRVHVYSINDTGITLDNIYTGLSEAVSKLNLMDDLTLDKSGTNSVNMSSTVLFGADWTGKAIFKFSLDGSSVSKVDTGSIALYEPTSVRYGFGPGYRSSSIYVTEGGGATPHVVNRRVVEIKINN